MSKLPSKNPCFECPVNCCDPFRNSSHSVLLALPPGHARQSPGVMPGHIELLNKLGVFEIKRHVRKFSEGTPFSFRGAFLELKDEIGDLSSEDGFSHDIGLNRLGPLAEVGISIPNSDKIVFIRAILNLAFDCRNFDREGRMCLNYGNRPLACNDYSTVMCGFHSDTDLVQLGEICTREELAVAMRVTINRMLSAELAVKNAMDRLKTA